MIEGTEPMTNDGFEVSLWSSDLFVPEVRVDCWSSVVY